MALSQMRLKSSPLKLDNLPRDIVHLIVQFCDKTTLCCLRFVSQSIYPTPTFYLYRLLAEECQQARHFHLHRAAALCFSVSLRSLIDHGTPINNYNDHGECALHVAVRSNCRSGSIVLLESGTDVNAVSSNGWTSLHLAARYGYHGILELLLQYGAEANGRGFHGWTALHFASREGYLQTVRALLEAGACSSIRDNDGKSALDMARQFGHEVILRHLLAGRHVVMN